jgi:hypothetical protein
MFSSFHWHCVFRICIALTIIILVAPCGAQPKPEEILPDRVVSALYHDYAWEVVLSASKYTELVDQPQNELEKYFSPALVQLLLKDRSCKEKTGDVCGLDFDPIYASQDRASVYELEIKGTGSKNEVKVQFKISRLTPSIELSFKMAKTHKGWRIDDIDYGKGRSSLRAVLHSPVAR